MTTDTARDAVTTLNEILSSDAYLDGSWESDGHAIMSLLHAAGYVIVPLGFPVQVLSSIQAAKYDLVPYEDLLGLRMMAHEAIAAVSKP